MIMAFADGADCQSGVSRAMQLSLGELNQEWLQSVRPRSPLAQFWLDNALWFILLAGGFGLASLLALLPTRHVASVER
jgi:hypothetical protein